MDDLFREKGTLCVSLGEGYLSAFEASVLGPGDVVRTTKMAGVAYAVLYEGAPFAQAEAVVLGAAAGGSVFGVRIVDTDFPSIYAFGPVRRDELGEMLPFVVRLGAIRVSLAELRGVGANSLVSLGTPWAEAQDADLVVAGRPIARGKVVVIGEEMGLRVTERLAAASTPPGFASSGFYYDRKTAAPFGVKDYDFRRPDKFSMQQILRIRDTHAMFLQNLRARLPELGNSIESLPYPHLVDQCTLCEAAGQLGASGLGRRLVVQNRPWRRVPREGDERPRGPEGFRAVVEEEGTANPLDPRVRAWSERYLSAQGLANRNAIFVHYADAPAVRSAVEQGQAALLDCLRAAWRTVVELSPEPVGPEEVERAGSLSPNEMVILVTYRAADGEKPVLALVYPYLTLEPFVRLLGR